MALISSENYKNTNNKNYIYLAIDIIYNRNKNISISSKTKSTIYKLVINFDQIIPLS